MSIYMFFAIFYYFSFEKGEDLHLNKYEFPESKDVYKSLIKKSLIKKGSEELNVFKYFRYVVIGKEHDPSFQQT